MLDEHGFRGTFFLTTSGIPKWSPTERAAWHKAAAAGHEMASHSVDHPHASQLDEEGLTEQVANAATTIKSEFGAHPWSFAYPFCEITPAYVRLLPRYHIASRGGGAQQNNVPFRKRLDPRDIPSQATMTEFPAETYLGWIESARTNGAWTVFMIHGLEGTSWGWQPIKKEVFGTVLSRLDSQREQIWTAPFGTVAAYKMASEIFQSAADEAKVKTGSTTIKWKRPDVFPKGTVLKVSLADAGSAPKVSQKSKTIEPVDGLYPVSFDAGMLKIEY
jgi:peptidoglycan/xylan/chitin deacetylase (PgdA/CDA1 family)